jgi:hypothetical protein
MCICTGIMAFYVLEAGVGRRKSDTIGVGAVKAYRRWNVFSINAHKDEKL